MIRRRVPTRRPTDFPAASTVFRLPDLAAARLEAPCDSTTAGHAFGIASSITETT
ncbi:hypothetical protein [Haloechinothrix sp. LS1_15]|uniref:hypothetical protein n=1 Tax=Haloechinothrix sp. LS1_15 TaxID=2652248 RepID=UPI00294B21C8|nr:hypothetical protein [Haloechinothrix sp. LS1_15]